MKRSLLIFLLSLCMQGDVRRVQRRSAVAGIIITDLGNTVQASGHTCTIASATLATGDSVAASGAVLGLGGTLTATWNSISMTESGGGIVAGDGNEEQHMFTLDNVTGATGSVVITKTDVADDSVQFDCAAVRITGLTTKALDQTATSSGTNVNWTTTATATTTAAAEGLAVFLQSSGNTAGTTGTWQNSFTRLARVGQSAGTCCLIDYGYRVVSSTGAYTGAVNANGANTGYSGVIFTFK